MISLVGLGGLGSFVLYSLVSLGFKEIEIIDYDKVEESNLNRQILYDYSSIGKYKVDIAYEKIKLYNPTIKIYKVKEDIRNYKPKGNIIIDCLDDIKTKFFLENYNKPVLHLSAKNNYGFVYFYNPKFNYPLEKILFGYEDEEGYNINTIMITSAVGINLLIEYTKNRFVFDKFIRIKYPYHINIYKIKWKNSFIGLKN